jgi:hypothetical protein
MKMDAEKIGFLRIIQADDASDDAIVHVIKQDSL